ncbi:MAG: hydroxymethylglutaryl-CoA synthase [Bacillota bacterium]
MDTGILSYGVYIPRHRVAVKDIWQVWQNVTPDIFDRMSLCERAVLLPDEDTITLAVAAAQQALERSALQASEVDALILGTCTNPYDTKASVTVIGDALGLPGNAISFDLQFGTKSGTAALLAGTALVESGFARHALVIAADTLCRHTPPGVQMEYSASAAAVAFLLGKANVAVRLEGFACYNQDLSDYFRLAGDRYIRLGGGWLGYISNWGLLECLVPAARALFAKLDADGNAYDAVCLHHPNGLAPMMVAGQLGLDLLCVMPYVFTPQVGNTGSASALLGLAHFLDYAEPGQRVLVGSYGYGAGADCLSFATTDLVVANQGFRDLVSEQMEKKTMLDYASSLKSEFKLMRPPDLLTNYL